MRKLLLPLFFLLVLSVQSQTDSLKYAQLDSLSPDQLLQYYINEPEPYPFYKGPDTGDSVFYVLRPLTIPTNTVDAEPLSIRKYQESGSGQDEGLTLDTTNTVEQKLKPKVSLGMGNLAFHGDLYKRQSRFQSPLTSRSAFELGISQRMTRYLQLNFNAVFGKLGATERLNNRQENFQSEIRAGGLSLFYDFGNFIPDRYRVRPYVSFGAFAFEYLSKTDLKDKDGNTYFYWSDGSIKDKAEGSADAQNARNLVRDYNYESDIRELNKDGFGKYKEVAFGFPLGAGFVMKITNRVDLKLNFQYFITTTDYIDGITEKSIGNRVGTKKNDNFSYTSFSLQYDLIAKPRKKQKTFADTVNNNFWLTFDNQDMDKDGVKDLSDDCAGTPEGAKVDAKGCPLDDDGDGIPNYRDDELTTPPGTPVNARGVGQTDDYWQAWYDQYLNDSVAVDKETETIGNIFANQDTPGKKKKKKKTISDNYTVELVRYKDAIPSDELAFLLSIGDINSTTLADGTTVVYTSGNYDKISTAIKRRDEFRGEGIKGAGISKLVGKNVIPVSDAELEQLLKAEKEEVEGGNGDPSGTDTPQGEEQHFGKDDIVYRVQLGAFRNRISTSVFNTSAGSVLELKTGESIYRYVTKGYKTIEEAAGVRADLVVQGYSDAFVTAYRGGKRIALSETKATVETSFKEDLNENKMFSSIDKKLVAFKVQLGPLKKKIQEASMDAKVKDLTDVQKEVTLTGSIRYTSGGSFAKQEEAEKYRKELESKGFTDALIIATFKDKLISLQEAMELLK